MRIAVLIMLMSMSTAALAQDRMKVGEGRLFNNDYIGDGEDRWRTGSYVYSHLRAPRTYDKQADFAFGELLEYRIRGEIIASDPSSSAPGDRPYVGALSFGVHTHYNTGSALVSLGADVIAIGPQTGMSRFQSAIHDALDMPEPVFTDAQLGDNVYVQGSVSVGHTYQISNRATLRPFAEAQIGAVDLVRFGGDIVVGEVGQDDLLLRDVTTGQLYRGTDAGGSGFSYVLGADFTRVGDSVYLPEDSGVTLEKDRMRARAGVNYQHREGVSFFYGLTYLSEEFEGQPNGQVIGSVKLNFNF